MLVFPEYCVSMARYNAWQNKQLRTIFDAMPEAELRRDRKAFFGSLLATANHILWGDLLWMSRFDGGPVPEGTIATGIDLTPTPAVWAGDRFRADARILSWAEGLGAVDLKGDLKWYSGAMERDVTRPLSLCIAHFFNHQTHHRGQIHAMLTAAGVSAPVSDLAFMPEDGPWL